MPPCDARWGRPGDARSKCRSQRAIEAVGCRLLYLPPYSPDLNPIENWFAKLKASLRTAAARTVDGVYEAMREAVGRVTPGECLNYLRHCGYVAGQAT